MARLIEIARPIVLASGSPRRRRLLEQAGLAFEILPSDIPESLPEGTPPERFVEALAEAKAKAVAPQRPQAFIIAADTIVVLDGAILTKPRDEAEACAMLRRLSGRKHLVYTGFCLLDAPSGRRVLGHETTRVTFSPLTEAEIRAYVATGSPLDKAGAYGIQDDLGALFIRRIEGDYYNVVGFPLSRFYRALKAHFPDLVRPARSQIPDCQQTKPF
ncbi:MAG: Maf family protein [Bacteroidetes bacterium]|nr:Maf family protein [Rhodothermia bacterium]MCS7155887.1 Maf family protein [Bacteroidota bacterium]MCX7906012.1 Maf family protein [Bacteroidota bacterium]MDW8138140.1 Maf family protein [Bacteroidota bacterium]MDW8285824.1 Maf family protein [Bacteroidota bacterium]